MGDVLIERGAFAQLQESVASALREDRYFSDIRVITERTHDLENEIQRGLSGLAKFGDAAGIVAIVVTPRGKVGKPNLSGPHFDDVTVIVRVLENVNVNMGKIGTKKPASECAEVIASILHHLMIPGFHASLNIEDVGIVSVPQQHLLAYDVRGSTQVTIKRRE